MPSSIHEANLLADKARAFHGKAKVSLSNLRFEGDEVVGTRILNPRNITRLRNIFELEGCLRLEPEHHVPAIIETSILEAALRASKLQLQDLKTGEPRPLTLPSGTRLLCLHGRHRVEAAKQHFGPAEKWWVVDLYSCGRRVLPKLRRAC